jgi:CubicO group peptidase (beta-lactamase class C family)
VNINHLTAAQRTASRAFLGDSDGWGCGVAVALQRSQLWSPDCFGWTGRMGTAWASDPSEQLVGIPLTQCNMSSPSDPPIVADFLKATYRAIDD